MEPGDRSCGGRRSHGWCRLGCATSVQLAWRVIVHHGSYTSRRPGPARAVFDSCVKPAVDPHESASMPCCSLRRRLYAPPGLVSSSPPLMVMTWIVDWIGTDDSRSSAPAGGAWCRWSAVVSWCHHGARGAVEVPAESQYNRRSSPRLTVDMDCRRAWTHVDRRADIFAATGRWTESVNGRRGRFMRFFAVRPR